MAYSFFTCCSANTSSQSDIVPFQVYPVNYNCLVCLTNGEIDVDNYILSVREKDDEKHITILADPCVPIIHSINKDTIYVDYYAFGDRYYSNNTVQRSPFRQNKEIIGEYTVFLRYFYSLESEKLHAHWEPKTQSYGWYIDSIFIKRDSVYCFDGTEHIKTIPTNRFFYRQQENKFCTFEIDSNYKNILWFYYFPAEEVKQYYCKYFSSLIDDH